MDRAPFEIVVCVSFVRDQPSRAHELVRAWRSGDPVAAAEVLCLAGATLERDASHLVAPGTLAVAVPGHRAREANAPCEGLIAALTGRFPGLVAARGVLVRVADAPEGKTGPVRDASAEVTTLHWNAPLVPPDVERVLLVDDVVRTGASLRAALGVIPAALAPASAALAVFCAVEASDPQLGQVTALRS